MTESARRQAVSRSPLRAETWAYSSVSATPRGSIEFTRRKRSAATAGVLASTASRSTPVRSRWRIPESKSLRAVSISRVLVCARDSTILISSLRIRPVLVDSASTLATSGDREPNSPVASARSNAAVRLNFSCPRSSSKASMSGTASETSRISRSIGCRAVTWWRMCVRMAFGISGRPAEAAAKYASIAPKEPPDRCSSATTARSSSGTLRSAAIFRISFRFNGFRCNTVPKLEMFE